MAEKTTKKKRNLKDLLLPSDVNAHIKAWLKEDVPSFDYGGYVVGDTPNTARLLGKSKGILAGRPFFQAVFDEVGCTVEWNKSDGDRIDPICEVAIVRGPIRKILLGERLALNIITRASGIATEALRVRAKAIKAKWKGHVAGTRKLTPGFRLVEKYALLVGGVSTHRMDLSSMVMLKDNHIWSTGSITKSVEAAKRATGFSTMIEVECQSLEEALEAGKAGAHIVMLDNFKPGSELFDAAATIKSKFPHLTIEASGGIRSSTIESYFNENIDVLSMGALTQGYPALDFSLKVDRTGGSNSRNISK